MSLEALIKAHIRQHGSLSIADYMEWALAHPEYGYYMHRDPFGSKGDFTTAPEISQLFGELIGAWLAHQWQLLGAPQAALVELGPGRGTLMQDIVRATKQVKGFHEAVSIHLVEISPTLKQKQWQTLAGKHAKLEWHDTIDTLPDKPLLLVANEFFDALPIRQWVEQGGTRQERTITLMNDQLAFAPEAQSATIHETCEPALDIIKRIAQHLLAHSGAALIVDYGYIGGSTGDTLQALKNHQYADILQQPGSADLTAHVDFSALTEAAQADGLHVHGPTPQGAFLMRLGAGTRTTALCQRATPEQQRDLLSGLKRLASPEEMGELFKVLAITSDPITHAEGF